MINLSMAEPDNILRPRIAVMGVGGAGTNAINNMIHSQLQGCDFIAANTDAQALAMSMAPHKMQLGINLSRGLGAGSKPEIGRAAAEEQLNDILAALEGADMLFITAGMGGGTGTGAAPVIARAARESGILTVGVVTKPFHFEGSQRMRKAEMGIAELQQYVDTLIVIPNQNLFRIANERTTFAEAFRMADEVLNSGVRGITDLMVMPGFMNLDFADVKTVMQEMGKAMMGTGEADGDNRAIRAAEAAISNPLLDDISMKGARGVLINITGGMDMTLFEVDQAATRIREEVDPEAQIKVGSTLGEDLDGKIRVSVIATGIDAALAEQQKERAAAGAAAISTRTTQPSAMAQPVMHARTNVVEPSRAEVKTAQVTTPATTVTTPSVNTSSSYFTMPQMVTPQMLATQAPASRTPAAEAPRATTEPSEQISQPMSMAARQAEMLLATQAAAAPRPIQQKPVSNIQARTPVRSNVVSPVRSVPPAPHNAEPADIRMTQLTTPTSSAPATNLSTHGSQRAQSLFQRITGFGLIRPSNAERDELDDEEPMAEQPRLGAEPTERPTVAASEPTDLLDIPAFLRRQTNN